MNRAQLSPNYIPHIALAAVIYILVQSLFPSWWLRPDTRIGGLGIAVMVLVSIGLYFGILQLVYELHQHWTQREH